MIKFLLILSSLFLSYFAAFVMGVSYEKNKMVEISDAQMKKVVSNVESVDKKLNDNSKAQEEIKQQLYIEQRKVNKEVIKYAQKPDSSNVVLDDDWVRIYNSSNASSGSSNTNPSQVPSKT